jgi:hypothetical protein
MVGNIWLALCGIVIDFIRGSKLDLPEAKQYLAVLIDDAGRVLLRNEPGVGGYFIRTELTEGKAAERAIIDSVFFESGLRVKVASVGDGLYFGGAGTCAYVFVELVNPSENGELKNSSVDWFVIDEAYRKVAQLKNDNDFELETALLCEARAAIEKISFVRDEGLNDFVYAAELESFRDLCLRIESMCSADENGFQFRGGGLGLVKKMLAEMEGRDSSDYINYLSSKIDKKVRTKTHQRYLEKLVLVYAAQAYSCLKAANQKGYKEAFRQACNNIEKYFCLYPLEEKALRERGYKGGVGKSKNKMYYDRAVHASVLKALQKNAPYRARLQPRIIARQAEEEVLIDLGTQGIKCEAGETYVLILEMLEKDSVARKIIAGN